MKIRLEIDFYPPDEAFDHLGTDSTADRVRWARRMVQKACPLLRGEWFDVTILDVGHVLTVAAPSSAEPAVAVPDEALTCPARAFGACIARGVHYWHKNATGGSWSPAVESKHPFGAGDGERTLKGPL